VPGPAPGAQPAYPVEIEQIIDKALEKDRALRYQHVDDVLADLRRAQRAVVRSSSSTQAAPQPLTTTKVASGSAPWRRHVTAGRVAVVAGVLVAARPRSAWRSGRAGHRR